VVVLLQIVVGVAKSRSKFIYAPHIFAVRPLALQRRVNQSCRQKYQQLMLQHGDTAKKIGKRKFPALQNTSIGYHNSSTEISWTAPREVCCRQTLSHTRASQHQRRQHLIKRGYFTHCSKSHVCPCEAFNTDLRLDPEVNQPQSESENELGQYLSRVHRRVENIAGLEQGESALARWIEAAFGKNLCSQYFSCLRCKIFLVL
jgi:hypothetical protein